MMKQVSAWGAAVASCFVAASLWADVDVTKLPAASTQKDLSFDKHVKPIFEKSCVQCHGPEKQKAKLRLDSRDATLKGTGKQKVILPGKSEKSALVHAIARLVEDDAMPPEGKGDPLTKDQVGLVRAWIDQGAK
jgi:mono/diheme cytochrome c family protein